MSEEARQLPPSTANCRWGVLEIETFGDNEEAQAYAAGVLEGERAHLLRVVFFYRLAYRKTDQTSNLLSFPQHGGQQSRFQASSTSIFQVEGMCDPTPAKRQYCKRLYKYLKANQEWVKSQVEKRNDDYWRMVGCIRSSATGERVCRSNLPTRKSPASTMAT